MPVAPGRNLAILVEVAASGESLVSPWPRPLIQGNPLRPRVGHLDAAPVRDLKIHADLDVTVAELCDCPIEILDPVHEDWLVALEMAREQKRGRIRGQSHHRHPCPERLDREYRFRPQPMGEVFQVAGDVPARQVDEVEPIEHRATEAPAPR